MFPYVCLATMPLFCSTDWPRRFGTFLKDNCVPIFVVQSQKTKHREEFSSGSTKDLYEKEFGTNDKSSINDEYREDTIKSKKLEMIHKNMKEICMKSTGPTKRQKFVVSLLLFHIFLQFFLPYSHFITKVTIDE